MFEWYNIAVALDEVITNSLLLWSCIPSLLQEMSTVASLVMAPVSIAVQLRVAGLLVWMIEAMAVVTFAINVLSVCGAVSKNRNGIYIV